MEPLEQQAFNPWTKGWLHPRQTVRHVYEHDAEIGMYILAALGGMLSVAGQLGDRGIGDRLGILPIIGIIAVAGPIVGLISLHIISSILAWTGSWFDGQATRHEIMYAFAWSKIPLIVTLVCWFLTLIVVGRAFVGSDAAMGLVTPADGLVILAFVAVSLVTYIWSLVLFFGMLSEVQRFPVWKAIVSALIPFIVIVAPAMIILSM